MTNNTTIDAVILDNLIQLVIYEQKDLFGALKYRIVVTKDGNELVNQIFEDRTIALNIFDGFKEYYSKDIAKLDDKVRDTLST